MVVSAIRAESPGDFLQTPSRALAVLEALAAYPEGTTPKAIARDLGLHLSTSYRLLNTVVAAGYAVLDGESRLYRLGPRISLLFNAFVASLRVPPSVQPFLSALQEATGEFVTLSQWLGHHVVTAAAAEPKRPEVAMASTIGFVGPPHILASGKVLLAWAAEGRVAECLADPELRRSSPMAMPTGAALQANLAQIRQAGYAADRGGAFVKDWYCLAAPVFAADATARYALAISASRTRIEPNETSLVAALRAIAQALTAVLASELDISPAVAPATELSTEAQAIFDVAVKATINAVCPAPRSNRDACDNSVTDEQ